MLRQLSRLTRRVPAAGSKALAIAVYSDADLATFGARETGIEGVACVDDAARAIVLLSQLWQRTGNPELRAWAYGLLDFVLWMHDGEGRWANFIYDWDGSKNLEGPTSAPGANFWQARAIEALAFASSLFDVPSARHVLRTSLETVAGSSVPPDVRAIHGNAALQIFRSESDPWLLAQVNTWCEELSACSSGGMLMNSPYERGRPHLWGHIQEAVLVEAGRYLARPDFITTARYSADAVFSEVIESGFELAHVHPYDVQSAVFVMDRLYAETGDVSYRLSADKARTWFGGRNPARVPVYMREHGRVADGIDDCALNGHSGAEANISAGLALMDDSYVRAVAAGWQVRQ